jgi:hypothetical protein
MILAIGEMEEEGEDFLTPEERLCRVENQLAALASLVGDLIGLVGVANSYAIIEGENAERARMVQEAKKNAAELGNLLHTLRERWPL